MTKIQFLLDLNNALTDLPRADVEERLGFYSEMIEDRMEDGLSEEQAVSSVGGIEEIAAQIRSELSVANPPAAEPAPKKSNRTATIIALILGSPIWISLLIAAFSVVFSLFVVVWSAVISFWAVFVSLAACALCGLFCGSFLAISSGISGVALIGAGIICAGLAIFLFFGCRAMTKGVAILTKRLALWIGKCFEGKGES